GLDELLDKNRSSIEFCSDYARALDTSLTFVIVPTPSLPNGDFSLEYLQPALNKLGEVLRQKKDFHIVSIVSTVLPGSMEILKQVLEEASQKKCGEEFGLCYNPAFIALGNVIANFLRPDFVLLGES